MALSFTFLADSAHIPHTAPPFWGFYRGSSWMEPTSSFTSYSSRALTRSSKLDCCPAPPSTFLAESHTSSQVPCLSVFWIPYVTCWRQSGFFNQCACIRYIFIIFSCSENAPFPSHPTHWFGCWISDLKSLLLLVSKQFRFFLGAVAFIVRRLQISFSFSVGNTFCSSESFLYLWFSW